jgi:hypothetical protein
MEIGEIEKLERILQKGNCRNRTENRQKETVYPFSSPKRRIRLFQHYKRRVFLHYKKGEFLESIKGWGYSCIIKGNNRKLYTRNERETAMRKKRSFLVKTPIEKDSTFLPLLYRYLV